ncbi:hypothetical protein CH276_22765 [Rhodococcus sp. 06-470-2]|uniref:hypothetical protein n=1 Tax=unclassified Rhodococcus (in: high G+C Gram-positive bacteria) TaxID=192944 RepID=UPI000B9BF4A1|nr:MULTISPECIES: hypothetical protein [unclassified Rhodococcus (in: high G+C Gram-positive bacteria)]OZC59272.1 hypothetical protein CH276_22765 [Rhodococcus sp. 06-470-2]OZE63624.1 hypothetical protein CH265_12165 [Rhodococcus sp. 05-2221-1B]
MTEWIDTIVRIFGVVGTIATAFLGAKLWQWRAQLRQLNAEASQAEAGAASGKADATETMVQTALLLGNPALVSAIGQRLTVLEKWAEDERSWQSDDKAWKEDVVARARAAGWDLPAPPTPPPFPRPGSVPV